MGNHSSSALEKGWPPSFQKQVVAALVRDPAFLSAHHDVIRPEFFDIEAYSTLADIALEHYHNYYAPLPLDQIDQILLDYCKKRSLDQDVKSALSQTIVKLIQADLSGIDWVSTQVVEFGRYQAFRKVVEKAAAYYDADAVDSSVLEEIRTDMERVLTLGSTGSVNALNLSDVLWTMPDINRAKLLNRSKVFTGFKRLDKALRGLGVGDVGIWAAPSGVGKSLILHNIMAYCIVNKIPVFLSTHENRQDMVASRILARITQTPIDWILEPESDEQIASYKKNVENFVGKDGKLDSNLCEIKFYPPGTCSVSNVRSYLSQLRASKGFQPKLILIDYADLLIPSASGRVREHLMTDSYQRGGVIMDEMAVLGDVFGTGVWTASQYNREGVKNARQQGGIGDMHHLADSLRKGNNAVQLITITQTLAQHVAGKAVAVVTKNRNGTTGDVVDLDIDYARMTIRESASQTSQETFYASTPLAKSSHNTHPVRGHVNE